jgi:hypothetical protein
MILQLEGDPGESDLLEAKLKQIGGLELQHMIFQI